jgi:hypothetical protein
MMAMVVVVVVMMMMMMIADNIGGSVGVHTYAIGR